MQRQRELAQAAEQQGELGHSQVGAHLAALDSGREYLGDPLHERRRGADELRLKARVAGERLADEHAREVLVFAHPLDVGLEDRAQPLAR